MGIVDIVILLAIVVAFVLIQKAQLANLSSIDATMRAILEELRSKPSS